MTPAELISQYNKIRASRLIIEAEQKALISPYKEAEETIELALLEMLNQNGLQNFKCEEGTAYKTTHTNTKLVDRNAFLDFVAQSLDFDFFTNSLAKEHVKEYVEKNRHPPPGVEVTETIVVNIRKS
jgi:hypothetical protein